MADYQLALTCTEINDSLVNLNQYVCDAGEVDQGVAGNGNSLKDLIDDIGTSTFATIYLLHDPSAGDTTTYTVTTAEAVPDNIYLDIQPGAVLDGAGTLTFDNAIQVIAASNQQVFGSSITVDFTNGGSGYPDWWGIDGTADDVQMNAAITSGLTLVECLSPAYSNTGSVALDQASVTFKIGNSTITSTANPVLQITADDVQIEGINRYVSKVINTTANEWLVRSVGATRTGITIDGIYFSGGNTVAVAQVRQYEGAIWFGTEPTGGDHTNVTIKNCHFTDCLVDILFEYVNDSKIINNTFSHDTANNMNVNIWSCERVNISGNHFLDTSAGCTNAIEVLGASDDNSSEIIIEDNIFKGDYTEVINLAAKKSQVIANNIYSNAGTNHQGIQVIQATGHTQNECYENIVSNNYLVMANANAAGGIGLKDAGDNYGVKRCQIKNNTVIYGGETGAMGSAGQDVSNNIFEGNIIVCSNAGAAQYGLYIGGTTCVGNILRNNVISGAGKFGIYLNTAGATTVDRNEITTSTESGIQIAGGSGGNIVTNNRSYSNTTYGIYAATSAGIYILVGNVCYSNTTADISISNNTTVAHFSGNFPSTESLTGTITANRYIANARIDSSGGAVTATQGDGVQTGQIKTFSMSDASSQSTVSVTNHRAGDPTVGTFNAVDEAWTIVWTGTEWDTLLATCTF